jgi:PadR family transcriptional regulator PadR
MNKKTSNKLKKSMSHSPNKILEKEIIKQHHDQIVFDLKRAFLQSITLLLINKGPKYTYEIKADILKLTKGGFDIDRNNLYKKLRLLEKDGILKSQLEPSAKGAQRKYYTITPQGKVLLAKSMETLYPLLSSLRENIVKKYGRKS